MSEQAKNTKGSLNVASIIRVIIIVVIIGLIITLMALNTPNTQKTYKPTSEKDIEELSQVWDEGTTQGSENPENYYIMYTDIMCPYCDYFSRAIMKKQDEFEKYLADHNIRFELRVTDFLYEYNNVSEYSQQSAEATYCARKEGKFWDYYHAVLTALNKDYHSKGIGNAKGAPMITDITDKYWLNIGHKIGLGKEFDKCYKNHETLPEVKANTAKAAEDMQELGQGGLPLFRFNKFVTSGFDPSWDWEYVKKYFDEGLK